VTKEKLAIVRKANAIVEEEVMEYYSLAGFCCRPGNGHRSQSDNRVYGWWWLFDQFLPGTP